MSALHVLRLVWRQNTRQRSIASLADWAELDDSSSEQSFFAPADQSVLAEHANTTQGTAFLECESREYDRARLALPIRRMEPIIIPWPTIFPPLRDKTLSALVEHRIHSLVRPREARHFPDHPLAKPKPCDPIARLVLAGDLAAAGQVYTELRDSHTPQARFIYLPAAVSCLEAGDQEGFIFWLKLYPNRPATKDHSDLRQTWFPILSRLLRDHRHDTAFLTEFTYLAASKGILPTIIHPMLRHFTHVLPPQESIMLFRRALELYREVTIPNESQSERGHGFRLTVHAQLDKWWNAYLRALVSAGWQEAAAALYRQSDAVWDDFTRQMMVEFADKDACQISGPDNGSSTEDDQVDDVELGRPDLPKQIRRALRYDDGLKGLSKVLVALQQVASSHPTLSDRFHRRFCQPLSRTQISTHHTVVTRQRAWWHAVMLNYQNTGDDQAVIRTFLEHFHWIGLPGSPPTTQMEAKPLQMSPLYPSRRVLITFLESHLKLLPEPIARHLPSFHSAYLAHAVKLSPQLSPDPSLQAVFLTELCQRLGLEAGLDGLNEIIQAGFDPGPPSYSVILRKCAEDREHAKMFQLLDQMEARSDVEGGGSTFSAPAMWTYVSLVRILNASGHRKLAGIVMMRGRRQHGEARHDVENYEAEGT
ncbi:MAG: hypothetical protein TREMPRED_001374 [Tremellales sp. Tagirdzhanova-0007]|nr:MAG: hypothetical protein TREMPRED_001374 [Tremellales sp. Tagirdzhanova-0007]